MGALTEIEIFDRMLSSLRTAAECCDDIARLPLKGPTYDRLRKELRLIEGCCKQAAVWREDTRWLPIGLLMAECHKRAGDWLRGIKLPNGARVKLNEGTLHPAFTMLADNLRGIIKVTEDIKNKSTGVRGMILPPVQRAPMRTQGRPIQVLLPDYTPPGKLILPDGMRVH